MKVLVTGGAGFIGSHLVESLQGRAEVYVLDNLHSGFRLNLEGFKCQFISGSIVDRDLVRRAMEGAEYVFHLAALVSVPESVQQPDEYAAINSTGTTVVLEEAARAGVKKVVFSSSSAIYGDDPVLPKTEGLPPDPKSPYAATKLQGERLCRKFAEAGGLSTVCLRYFNVFGPRQNPRSLYAAAVPAFIERALNNETLTIYGDGTQTRDFIFVKDIVAANIFFAMESPATGIFNVACGESLAINELASMIRRLTGSSSKIQHAAERAGDVKHSVASVTHLHAAGFRPRFKISDGLEATIQYFRAVLRPEADPAVGQAGSRRCRE
jgi:UDP-glucose 4-epimerase